MQDEGREDADRQRCERDHQDARLNEEVGDAGDEQHDGTDEQPLAHRRQVALDDRGQRCHAEKDRAVPAKAIMTRLAPLLRPSTAPTSRDSIIPMKKVKAKRIGTPAALFLVFSIANMKAKALPRNTIRPMPGVNALAMPVPIPTQAPSAVGTIESASNH